MEKTTAQKKLRMSTPAQRRVLDMMSDGHRLVWFGDAGPEMEGCDGWPQKRTVRALLSAGLLRWKPWANETQREAGIRELA